MENTYQQTCKACEQVITLSTPDPLIEYCLACAKELDDWYVGLGFYAWAANLDAWTTEGV